MYASKENCGRAMVALETILAKQDNMAVMEEARFVKELLDAAYRRLPTEAAIQKDKARRRAKTKGK